MQKWMAFLGTTSPVSFRLIAASDIDAAIKIGEELANREATVLVGISVWAERE